MARLIGIDLSSSPAYGVVIEVQTGIGGNNTEFLGTNKDKTNLSGLQQPDPEQPENISPTNFSLRCLASFALTPENNDDVFQQAIVNATGSAAVINPAVALAMTISLPFSDRKRVNALLPQELEDTLPFPAAEFALGYGLTGSSRAAAGSANSNAMSYQFHLQLAPREYIRNALAELSSLGIDPSIVTPRSSLLTPIAQALLAYKSPVFRKHGFKSTAADGSFLENSALEAERELIADTLLDSFFIVVPRSLLEGDILFVIGRRVVHHQQIKAIRILGNKDPNILDDGHYSFEASVLLELGSVFKRFNAEITTGFVVVPPTSAFDVSGAVRELSNIPQLTVEVIQLEQLFPSLSLTERNERAVLAALCSLDESGRPSLIFPADCFLDRSEPVNFRRGEFSYRPAVGEVTRVAKKLIRPALLTLACGFVCAAAIYLFRAQEIGRLESRISAAVQNVAPQLSAESGKELTALADEASKMEQELKDIGTSDSSSPLELYAELTKHFPQLPDTSVDRVAIRGNRIEIRGCAPSYRVIEQIENALTKVKLFGKVKKGSSQSCSSGASGSRGFTFEVTSRD